MGLIIPQIVKVRVNKKMRKYYREKGYEFEKYGDFIEVNVMDLYPGSHTKVKCNCDFCGKETEVEYRKYIKNKNNNKLLCCNNGSCKGKQIEDICMKKYNVINVSQIQEVKNKKIETCREHFGVDHPFQSNEVQDKSAKTLKKNYGVENPMQNEEIKNKVLNSCQFNSTGPCSRAQRYINHILNGTLNKRICGSLVDIYMEKENIVIEHDGGGHFLGDKMNGNKTPTKESFLYEKEREDKIINNGYKMIRFIAVKDRIPSDEVILNLVDEFKNSDFKVIRINFEEGTIEKDYNKKSHHDFGELRRITKEDLEKFEKQEENTSEN